MQIHPCYEKSKSKTSKKNHQQQFEIIYFMSRANLSISYHKIVKLELPVVN